MKLTNTSKSKAQAWADKAHDYMIANDTAYAQSVKDGQTTAWDVPQQELDGDGKIIDPLWSITLADCCIGAFTAAERKLIV